MLGSWLAQDGRKKEVQDGFKWLAVV